MTAQEHYQIRSFFPAFPPYPDPVHGYQRTTAFTNVMGPGLAGAGE
jgi:hypothetical protein